MLRTSIKFTAVFVMLTIGSHAAIAAQINPSPFSIRPTLNAGKAKNSCDRDYKKCLRNVKPLCRRLLKRGMGGGSMSNCTERKERRCSSKLNDCEGGEH